MKTYLLLALVVAAIITFTYSSTQSSPVATASKEVNWFPVYSYHNAHIKIFIDLNSLETTKVKGSLITGATLLIVPDEDGSVETKEKTTDPSKPAAFKSIAVIVGVDCADKAMMTIANLYFAEETPTIHAIPVSVYQFPTSKDSIVGITKDNFVYKTLCAVSV
jgi:hypothetical protein